MGKSDRAGCFAGALQQDGCGTDLGWRRQGTYPPISGTRRNAGPESALGDWTVGSRRGEWAEKETMTRQDKTEREESCAKPNLEWRWIGKS